MESAEGALRKTVEEDGGERWQNQQKLAEELGYQTALLAGIGDKSKQKVPVPLPMKGDYFNLDLTEREAFLDLLETSKAADTNIVECIRANIWKDGAAISKDVARQIKNMIQDREDRTHRILHVWQKKDETDWPQKLYKYVCKNCTGDDIFAKLARAVQYSSSTSHFFILVQCSSGDNSKYANCKKFAQAKKGNVHLTPKGSEVLAFLHLDLLADQHAFVHTVEHKDDAVKREIWMWTVLAGVKHTKTTATWKYHVRSKDQVAGLNSIVAQTSTKHLNIAHTPKDVEAAITAASEKSSTKKPRTNRFEKLKTTIETFIAQIKAEICTTQGTACVLDKDFQSATKTVMQKLESGFKEAAQHKKDAAAQKRKAAAAAAKPAPSKKSIQVKKKRKPSPSKKKTPDTVKEEEQGSADQADHQRETPDKVKAEEQGGADQADQRETQGEGKDKQGERKEEDSEDSNDSSSDDSDDSDDDDGDAADSSVASRTRSRRRSATQ